MFYKLFSTNFNLTFLKFYVSGHPPYRNAGHSQKALEGFKTMRDGGLLTDVILVAGDTELPAHRTLLVNDLLAIITLSGFYCC